MDVISTFGDFLHPNLLLNIRCVYFIASVQTHGRAGLNQIPNSLAAKGLSAAFSNERGHRREGSVLSNRISRPSCSLPCVVFLHLKSVTSFLLSDSSETMARAL